MIKRCKVIIPETLKPKPSDDEQTVAKLMARYLSSDIIFVRKASSTTPDIKAIKLNQIWEIKNIRGNNKNTINRTLKGIYKQSENVVISLSRTSMQPDKAASRAREKLKRANRIKRLVIITKFGKILEIK